MTKIAVFDIDGTLANVDHRRKYIATKPRNWPAWNAAMDADTVYDDIKSLLDTLRNAGNTILLCSGRGEETRSVTERWLSDNGIRYEGLYMRAEKDYRPDSIVKVELLDRIREDHGEPYLWIDDRQSVVDAIRAQGVRVLQVAPGNF